MHRFDRLLLTTAMALAGSLGAVAPATAGLTPGQLCEKKAATILRTCDKNVAKQQLVCMKATGALCLPADPKLVKAYATLESRTLDACPDAPTLAGAGYSALLTPAGFVARLKETCESAAVTLAARSFGGPQAASRATATAADKDCLDRAYDQGRKMLDYRLKQLTKCVLGVHAGKTCDPVAVNAKIAAREGKTATAIAARCTDLPALVSVDPATFVSRTSGQADCQTATVLSQTAPLALTCGPRASIPVPALATPTQVVLDSNTWGTRCGDGTPYAFWIRLAPAGQPVNRVVIHMAGGGNCTDGPDCASQNPDLFESVGDTMAQTAMMNSTNVNNPFKDWTKVFLPYCTQDDHTGGGVVNAFPEMTVYRYGALNVRATMRYLRDVLWASMDANDPEGFRPDKLTVLFSGSSAGGGGATFNYHYLLDDLRWTHTSMLPDSALSMDNGSGLIATRGALALSSTFPGWGALPYAAPFCHAPECAELLDTVETAYAPRLKAVPEQQILNVANQLDNIERNVLGFATSQDHMNALRGHYCTVKNLNGIHSYLGAEQPWVHGTIADNQEWNNMTVGGTRLRDWVGGAMTSPDAIPEKAGIGNLEASFPGLLPFPCATSSPSGAFVD